MGNNLQLKTSHYIRILLDWRSFWIKTFPYIQVTSNPKRPTEQRQPTDKKANRTF